MLAMGPQTCYFTSLGCDFLKFKCNNLYSQSCLGKLNEMKDKRNSWVSEKKMQNAFLIRFYH